MTVAETLALLEAWGVPADLGAVALFVFILLIGLCGVALLARIGEPLDDELEGLAPEAEAPREAPGLPHQRRRACRAACAASACAAWPSTCATPTRAWRGWLRR